MLSSSPRSSRHNRIRHVRKFMHAEQDPGNHGCVCSFIDVVYHHGSDQEDL